MDSDEESAHREIGNMRKRVNGGGEVRLEVKLGEGKEGHRKLQGGRLRGDLRAT